MKILAILQVIPRLYQNARRQGHTRAMLHGAVNTPGLIILTHDREHARQLSRENPGIEFASIQDPDALVGKNAPMMVDHHALSIICSQSAARIQKLETINELSRIALEGQERRHNEQLDKCRKALESIKRNTTTIQALNWGNDGDCGALRVAERIEEICDETIQLCARFKA